MAKDDPPRPWKEPPRPPRPQGQLIKALERSGGPWALSEAAHRAWHAAAEAAHYGVGDE